MKKLIFLILVVIGFTSCDSKYKYKINGLVRVQRNGKDSLMPAIAYTDTIHGKNQDSIWYYNSDGSKLTLESPYTITKIK